jgi:hypothetical protein
MSPFSGDSCVPVDCDSTLPLPAGYLRVVIRQRLRFAKNAKAVRKSIGNTAKKAGVVIHGAVLRKPATRRTLSLFGEDKPQKCRQMSGLQALGRLNGSLQMANQLPAK